MEQENNELDVVEFMKIIYKEVLESKEIINKKIDKLGNNFEDIKKDVKNNTDKIDILTNKFDNMNKDVKQIKIILDKHSIKLEEHDEKFKILEEKSDKIEEKLDNLDKIERLHFEYSRNKLSRIDRKIDSNFYYLENKIEDEIEKRKEEISRIDGKENFDKIVLSDFGSRISILEEETGKYSVN